MPFRGWSCNTFRKPRIAIRSNHWVDPLSSKETWNTILEICRKGKDGIHTDVLCLTSYLATFIMAVPACLARTLQHRPLVSQTGTTGLELFCLAALLAIFPDTASNYVWDNDELDLQLALSWWKVSTISISNCVWLILNITWLSNLLNHKHKYPVLASLAQDYVTCPGPSAAADVCGTDCGVCWSQ